MLKERRFITQKLAATSRYSKHPSARGRTVNDWNTSHSPSLKANSVHAQHGESDNAVDLHISYKKHSIGLQDNTRQSEGLFHTAFLLGDG